MKSLEQSQQVLKNEKNELSKEKEQLAEKNQRLTNENADLTNKITGLSKEKADLTKANAELIEKNKTLTTENTALKTDKDNLTNQLNASQKQVNALKNSQQVLENEKAELLKDKEKLTTEKTELTDKNTELQNQVIQANQEKDKLEQKYAPYKKLERLYEVFLEVKDRLSFNFVATTHSAMNLIASVLSDSKYYLESLYNRASQELSDKKSDKGEKLAELFDLLFEYIKDSKFERLKEPSGYDHSCKKLYPEQNTSNKMQRVVLRGYTYDKKIACYTIVDMGS
ncbi:hypothetical protein ACEWX7_03280 [Helicobacter pylori]|uniref:hypothetical protein n=1 Tax=Helicobacter pylori TaxID=210 RepID=UPI0035A9019A